ncbi:hypothetical protein F4809DRAFT_622741 [Biscogniauxia mediterranea]|nr:hypothetical protein F4809DRAFT_622741 [Biscogniauxia mediterranea]
MDPQTLSQYLGYPIQQPPPGVIPNFENPESIAYQIYITASVCIPLMLVFSLIRFLSIIYISRKIVIGDEFLFVVGLVLCLGFTAMTIACVTGGAFGKHAWNVLLGAFTRSQLVLSLLVELFGPLATCSVKISVLVLYLQIFRILKWMRVISIAGIIVITAAHISTTITFAAMCAPRTGSGQLDFLAAFVSDTCSRTRILIVIQGIINVVTDIFLLILPLPAIWTLQMPLKRKLAISSMFLVGLCACASSIIGLVYRVRYFRAGQDNIFVVVPLWVTAIAEETAAIMICCMPTIAAVFKAAKKPVLTWLSILSERAQHRNQTFRPGVLFSGRNCNLGATKQHTETESGLIPLYCHPGPRNRHTAWVDTGVDTGVHWKVDTCSQ